MSWLPDLSLPMLPLSQWIQRLLAATIVIGVHGWAAAALSDRLGDPGPRYDGRMKPNPLAHLDALGLLHGVVFGVAWMARLAVEPTRLRWGRGGAFLMTVGASGVLALLAALLVLVRPLALTLLQGSAALTTSAVLDLTADVAILTAVAHLLPFPPFVGAAWAPWAARVPAVRTAWARYLGMVIVALLSLAGFTGTWGAPVRAAWRSWLGY